jgi:hypothetical protein
MGTEEIPKEASCNEKKCLFPFQIKRSAGNHEPADLFLSPDNILLII